MEQKILEMLYHRHYQTAYIYAYSLCHHKELSEDIVSSSFIKAYLYYNGKHEEFVYYLLRICKNTFLDIKRKDKHYSLHEINDLQLKDAGNQLEQLFKKDSYRILYQAILTLPKTYKEILILYYFGDISLIRISKILNISYGSVKIAICRSRNRVKRYMEEHGYGI